MHQVINITALAILLLLAQEFFRRAGRWANWGVWLGLPLIVTPHWLAIDHEMPRFWWVKLCSVLLVNCCLTLARYTALRHQRWVMLSGFCLLVINILEAIVQDLSSGRLNNYLNGAAGVLLIVTLIHRLDAIRIESNGHFEAAWDSMGRDWVFGYTLWNWVFVYLNFPLLAGQHFAVLASALFISIRQPQRWAQARVYTLGTYLLLLFSFPSLFRAGRMEAMHGSSAYGELAAVASLLYMIAFAGWFACARIRERTSTRHLSSPSGLRCFTSTALGG